MSVWPATVGRVEVETLAVPVARPWRVPIWVLPTMNLIVPVAVLAVWPPEATVAWRVTVVPWSTGVAGLGVSVVVVGVAGGGGSTSVPCTVRLISLIVPAKRLLSSVVASPQCPPVVRPTNLGIVKFAAEIVTTCVLVSYGADDCRTTWADVDEWQGVVIGEWIVTRTDSVSMMVTTPVELIDPVALPGVV